ncbi:MAG TPA: protein kinase [Thermoanaerobaculia bacterium]|nr:protein kinase [Thermoanaerobaculia bacterium]
MSPERWRRIDELFNASLGLGEGDRRRFLDRECAGDEGLRREVELLLAHDREDGFLEEDVVPEAARLIARGAGSSLVGGRVGRFEVEARIGTGGMGEVYRARDPLLERAVALKLVPAHLREDLDRRRRFRREALAASALNHPNIVTVHEIAEHDDFDLLVTELVEGESLRQRLERGPLEIDVALDVAAQIALGLAAAHRAGLVHRDIKPENVMLRPDGLVKILDFGIAKSLRPSALGGEPAGPSATLEGAVLGTLAYMSPEQARGRPIDARSDLWSLGVVLYEMVTGSRPFEAETPSDLLASILLAAPEPPSRRRSGLPAGVDELVARILAKDRADRFSDAATLALELKQRRGEWRSARGATGWRERNGAGALSTPRSPPRATSSRGTIRPRARSPAGMAGLALVVVAALLGSWRLLGLWGLSRIDSIAVLPLDNGSSDPELDYLSDGVTESLIQSLAQSGGLRVVSRAAVFRYKGRPLSTSREIGRELDVRSVLTGRLESRGDRLTMSVELVDARDDSHLWGRRYELGLSELTSLHEEVTADVLDHLHRSLSGAEQERVAQLHTDDVEAYRLYLEGRYYWNKLSRSDYLRSRSAFERAIAVDPRYALAWTGLGHYHGFAAANGLGNPAEHWPQAERAAERVLELDPDLPELASLQASIAIYWRRDWADGERMMERAVRVFPEATLHYSSILAGLGRREEARRIRQVALDQDPGSARTYTFAARWEYLDRRYERAASLYRRALELDPDDVATVEGLADVYLELGRAHEAVSAWHQALILTGRTEQAATLDETYRAGGLDAATGAYARTRRDDLTARAQRGEYVPAYHLARQSLRSGSRDAALHWIEKAFGERNRLVLDMLSDPVFDSVREEPAFRSGVRSLGLPAIASAP